MFAFSRQQAIASREMQLKFHRSKMRVNWLKLVASNIIIAISRGEDLPKPKRPRITMEGPY